MLIAIKHPYCLRTVCSPLSQPTTILKYFYNLKYNLNEPFKVKLIEIWNNLEVMKTLKTSLSPSDTLHGLGRMYHTTSSLHSKPRYLQAPLKCIRSATPQQFKNESVERAVYYTSVPPHRITFCPWSLLFACAGDRRLLVWASTSK